MEACTKWWLRPGTLVLSPRDPPSSLPQESSTATPASGTCSAIATGTRADQPRRVRDRPARVGPRADRHLLRQLRLAHPGRVRGASQPCAPEPAATTGAPTECQHHPREGHNLSGHQAHDTTPPGPWRSATSHRAAPPAPPSSTARHTYADLHKRLAATPRP